MIEEANKVAPQDRSVATLVTDMNDQIKQLIRDELRLAMIELQRKGKQMGSGAGLFGAAGIIALFGVATLLAAAVLALSLVMDGWLAAIIVGVVVLLIAGLTALVGKGQLKRATPVAPEDAVKGVRDDVETVKDGVRKA